MEPKKHFSLSWSKSIPWRKPMLRKYGILWLSFKIELSSSLSIQAKRWNGSSISPKYTNSSHIIGRKSQKLTLRICNNFRHIKSKVLKKWWDKKPNNFSKNSVSTYLKKKAITNSLLSIKPCAPTWRRTFRSSSRILILCAFITKNLRVNFWRS